MTDEAPAETLVRVTGPDFSAGAILLRGAVVRTGEKMRWALGLTAGELKLQLAARGWAATQRAAPAFVALDAC